MPHDVQLRASQRRISRKLQNLRASLQDLSIFEFRHTYTSRLLVQEMLSQPRNAEQHQNICCRPRAKAGPRDSMPSTNVGLQMLGSPHSYMSSSSSNADGRGGSSS
mmetsp:Transcript_99836/g.250269  ORF Transcript_99836/g.250269 Transcript_99836/m.250269 type:complete len:106 (+) Transcript_99836:105-422(+)